MSYSAYGQPSQSYQYPPAGLPTQMHSGQPQQKGHSMMAGDQNQGWAQGWSQPQQQQQHQQRSQRQSSQSSYSTNPMPSDAIMSGDHQMSYIQAAYPYQQPHQMMPSQQQQQQWPMSNKSAMMMGGDQQQLQQQQPMQWAMPPSMSMAGMNGMIPMNGGAMMPMNGGGMMPMGGAMMPMSGMPMNGGMAFGGGAVPIGPMPVGMPAQYAYPYGSEPYTMRIDMSDPKNYGGKKQTTGAATSMHSRIAAAKSEKNKANNLL